MWTRSWQNMAQIAPKQKANRHFWSRLSCPATEPPDPRRVSEGVSEGFFKGSCTFQPKDTSKPLQDAFKNPSKTLSRIANAPAPYRGLSGPSGPKCRESLENVSRGLRPRNPEKSPKSLRNSPRRLFRRSLETFRTVPETFWRLFGVRGRRPRETFTRLFRHFGREGPERPL